MFLPARDQIPWPFPTPSLGFRSRGLRQVGACRARPLSYSSLEEQKQEVVSLGRGAGSQRGFSNINLCYRHFLIEIILISTKSHLNGWKGRTRHRALGGGTHPTQKLPSTPTSTHFGKPTQEVAFKSSKRFLSLSCHPLCSPDNGRHNVPPRGSASQYPHGAGAPPAVGQEEPAGVYVHPPTAGIVTSFPGWTRWETPLHPLLPRGGGFKSSEVGKPGISLQSRLWGAGCQCPPCPGLCRARLSRRL